MIDSSEEEGVEPSAKIEASEMSSAQGRLTHKNKYINKIRDLGADEKNSLAKEECSARSLDKKERNKVSAKLSRDRKKLYI